MEDYISDLVFFRCVDLWCRNILYDITVQEYYYLNIYNFEYQVVREVWMRHTYEYLILIDF